MQKIIPFLWFDSNAEQAVNFYTSIFKKSKITDTTRYGEEGAKVSGRLKNSIMTISFELEGQEFMALNGGPMFNFSQAVSFVVNCKTQKEVDELWEKLSAEGGETQQCGWLKDKYGVPWQIVPTILGELMLDPNPIKREKVMSAMLQMTKIEIEGLKKAYNEA